MENKHTTLHRLLIGTVADDELRRERLNKRKEKAKEKLLHDKWESEMMEDSYEAYGED